MPPSYHGTSLKEKRAALLRAERIGAATEIQRVVRGHLARKRAKTMKKGGRRGTRRR